LDFPVQSKSERGSLTKLRKNLCFVFLEVYGHGFCFQNIMSKNLTWMFFCPSETWTTSNVESHRIHTDYTRKCNCTHIYRILGFFLSGSDGDSRSQWPRSLRHVSMAACLVALRVRIVIEKDWERRKIITENANIWQTGRTNNEVLRK